MRYRLWLVIVAAIVLFALPSSLLAQTPTRTSALIATPTPAVTVATVLKAANLRAGPGTTFAIAGKAKAGDKLNITGTNAAGTWYQTDNGMWIAAFLVKPVSKIGDLTTTALLTVTVVATKIVPTPIKAPTGSTSATVATNTPEPLPTVTPLPTEAPTTASPPMATPTPLPPTATSAPLPPTENCDPSYPGVCIPPAPPDLDCGDISFRRFQVVPPDPHRFDGDHDGIGCES